MNKTEIFDTLKNYFADKPVKKVSLLSTHDYLSKSENSTIVVILSMERPLNLLSLAAYRMDLEAIFGRPVDLGTEKGLSPWLFPLIENDIDVVYSRS